MKRETGTGSEDIETTAYINCDEIAVIGVKDMDLVELVLKSGVILELKGGGEGEPPLCNWVEDLMDAERRQGPWIAIMEGTTCRRLS